jgi:hypothetical protein
MHLDAYYYGFPVEDHLKVWNPLETLLSHWIDLIHLGKVVASPNQELALFDFEKVGPWEWRPIAKPRLIRVSARGIGYIRLSRRVCRSYLTHHR